MTNEEKAKEIAENNYNLFPNSSDITVLIDNNKAYCYESAMQAMQWKDEQFAEEKKAWIEKANNIVRSTISTKDSKINYCIEKGFFTIDDFSDIMEE